MLHVAEVSSEVSELRAKVLTHFCPQTGLLHADGTYAGGITFPQHCKDHYKTLEDSRKLMDKYTFIPEDCRRSIAEQVNWL